MKGKDVGVKDLVMTTFRQEKKVVLIICPFKKSQQQQNTKLSARVFQDNWSSGRSLCKHFYRGCGHYSNAARQC